jgi:protein-disulfide isomerase
MQKNNILQYVIVAVLIVGAFVIGSQRGELNTLKKGGAAPSTGTAGTGTAGTGETAFNVADLSTLAKNSGLKVADFEKCLNSDEIKAEVTGEQTVGSQAGVQGTPGVFLYDNQNGNIAIAPGAVPYEMLKPMVDKLIAGLADADKKKDTTSGIEYTDKSKVNLLPVQSTDYVKGAANARITLVEYSDYDCPFCKRFHPTAVQLLSEYKDQVNWVYRQFPLDQLHPNTRIKSQAARCAGKLGGADAFWKFTEAFAKM